VVHTVVNFIMEQFQLHKAHLIFIIIGLVVGLLSQMILPGRGFGLVVTILIGIAGCYLGNMFIRPYVDEYVTFTKHNTVHAIISGTIGAMALSLVINLIRGGKDKDKTAYRNNA
jgi:uncharacterized membrane protein YeaQ/YmgE (transglycosylase-associated protein family)